MNLDSLSLTVSQISYLVANLTKKNYKQNTSELSTLVERHGTEAERHLFRCLFSWIDFGGDGKSTGKDYQQTQLLIQEFSTLITRPSFTSTICHSLENPLSHQKSLFPCSSLLPNISRVLDLNKVQELSLGIALQHSTIKDLQKQATEFVESKFPEFIQFHTESGNRKSSEYDIGLQETPVEVLHFLLTYLVQSSHISSELKQSFFSLLKKDFSPERCPIALLPLIFFEEDDTHMEKLLADSSISPIMTSSSNSGGQKSSSFNSIADVLRETGYNSCSSVDECRKTLLTYKFRNVSAGQVARVLSMMTRTASEALEGVPLLQSGGTWADNKNTNEDTASSWNVDNFIQVAKEMTLNQCKSNGFCCLGTFFYFNSTGDFPWLFGCHDLEANSSLTARDVFIEFDHPDFLVEDLKGFRLLVRAIRLLMSPPHETFPIDILFRLWTNTHGQFLWIRQSLMNPNVFCIADHVTRLTNVEILKQPIDEENRNIVTWKSLDLVECLILLSDCVHYDEVKILFQYPFNNCPDLLALSLVQSSTSWQLLRRELIMGLVPVFLGSHPNAAMVLNNGLWNGQGNSSTLRKLVTHSMADWYMRNDQYDQQKLSRILDVAQDMKALSVLLNTTPLGFAIDLATLASRREFLKLDKWLSDKIHEHREDFIQACITFLQRRCPNILGGLNLKEEAFTSNTLPPETLTTILVCLRSFAGNVSAELSENIMTMVSNCTNLLNKTRPPPGVINKAPPAPPAPQPPQAPIPAPAPLPPANSGLDNMLTKPMDPVTGISGFSNKSTISAQPSLGGFNTELGSQIPGNGRMPSAIGPTNPGGSNISSPAGAGILPPQSGISDSLGMGSGLGSNPGAVGPVGASANSGGQFLGSSAFASSISQGLASQLGNGSSNSLGLSGGLTSTAGRLGSSQFGFGGGSLSQGFSSNPLLTNLGNVGGMSSNSDAFPNRTDFLPSSKPDLLRSKMPDLFQQQKQGLGSSGGVGMGVGLGGSLGGGMGSGLDLFGQKKQTMGSLGPAAQQAFQQAAAKTAKPNMNDFPQDSPELNRQFSKDIEDEANGYFQRIYNQPPHPTLSVDDILDLLQKFKDSNNTKEREVFNCMMRNLFEEYKFFPQYPDKELHITACLFGGIIEKNLVTYLPLGIALRYVLDALRKPLNSKMYYFGIAALDRFKTKLKDYPQYCGHIATIPQFKEFPGNLVEYVESGRKSEDPNNSSTGNVTTPGSIAFAAQQQQLGSMMGDVQAPQGGNVTPSVANPLPVRPATGGSKLALTTTAGKDIQQPSIAKATNIDTLLGAQVPEEKIPEPPENIQDKIAFIFNNLSVSNMTPKSDEMRDAIKDEYLPWLSQYLVMKRVSIEPNFHLLYSNFLDCLKLPRLNKLVKEEVFRNITVLLQSDKVAANFSDRSLLKNLGHFLGIISLAKNQPILHDEIALKPLLYEAYAKGAQELLYVVPFVAKVLESVGKSKVFKLPNPWTEAIMSVLVELHMEPDLKLNLKFEVEVLCKNLQIDINDIEPAHYLRSPDVKSTIDFQLSTSKKEPAVSSKPSTPSEQVAVSRTTTPMIMGMPGPSLTSGNFPPPSVPPPPPVQPQGQQPQPQQPPLSMPRFSFHDINVYSLNTLQSHLTIKMDLPLLQSQPQLKTCVRTAVERGVQDVVQVAVDRAIKIGLQTCEQIVRKDFALDPEELRMRTAAHNMVRNLTAGMALITCREQLLNSIQNYLKQNFIQALTRHPQAMGPQQKEMVDQAATVIAGDNVELGCCFIQKTAVEKATQELEKIMASDYELRKQARQEGRRYCDPMALTYQAERMPEQIRLKVGGVTQHQISVYEEFARCIPGFLPSTDASQPSGFLSKPMQNWAVDEITQIFDRCIVELEKHMQAIGIKQGTAPHGQLQSLHDALRGARNTREIVSVIALLQKAVEGLLDSPTQGFTDQETLNRYRECHLLVLKALHDQRAYGSQWTNKQITQCVVNHRDEYKYNNVKAVELLIKSHLIHMQLYDQQLAQSMENGLNYLAVAFAMQLVKLFLVDEKQGSPVTESDFFHTIEVLNKVNSLPRSQNPDGLPQLMELIRSNYDNMLEKGPGGATHMMHSGITQAREYDDPQGLHEKTEFLLREWVSIYHSPTSGRDSTRGFSAFVQQMHQQGILRTDDIITRFFRLCTEMCVDLTYRLLQESNVSPSLINPTLVRAKCFHTLDAFVRLITLLVKHSGDAVNSVTKINLLNKVLGIVVGVLLQDHGTRQTKYHQMPYHRIFIMLFYELNAPEHVLESINFQTLTAFTNTYHLLRPNKAPGFSFAWLELISYRAFISRMLLHTPQQKGWPMYAQLLIDLFKYLAPFLRNVELAKSIQILYKGTLRLLLVLLHDFPEFLCDYHYGFCDVIPANCIQLRNLILSAFPRNMRLPDPFTPNLKVDMLQEINVPPRILTNFVSAMPTPFQKDLDSYLKTRAPVTFLSDLRTTLQVSNEPGLKYNIPLINSLVMHVGTQAIAYIHGKGGSPSMATITHSSHMDIFQNLAVDLDTEGRYLFLNAIANQLRYPNSHTHYFSCTLLYLFAEANQEAIQEQITRVLLERLIVNRPHPWGLLITFIELIKNPNFNFWTHDFVHCAPEIEKLFESVARSCMGKQFNQQAGTDAAAVSSPSAPVAVVQPVS